MKRDAVGQKQSGMKHIVYSCSIINENSSNSSNISWWATPFNQKKFCKIDAVFIMQLFLGNLLWE
jgi:hypothetical protein